MNKKKMILTSLASVAILGAGFVTSQPTVVRAEESPQVVEKSSLEKKYEEAKAKADTARKITKRLKRKQKTLRKSMKMIRRELRRKLEKKQKHLKN